MKHFFTLCAAGVTAMALAGCTVEAPVAEEATIAAPASFGSSVSSYDAPPEVLPMQEIVLVDQDYSGIGALKGAEWLRGIKAKMIKGEITSGELVVTLERGADNTSWSAAGMYIAPLAQGEGFVYPNETVFGTNLHFLSAEWRGDCKRHLSPSSSFGVLKEHEATLRVNLIDVRMTQPDPCQKGSVSVNLIDLINGGVYLGFAPSDRQTAPYMKVVLRYRGNVEVKSF
jgi:hypothetical protein